MLRAYGKCSGDLSVQERIDVQTGMKMILKLCLADGFDMFPTLLVTDGSCMIDRRMGIHGHPLEIQVLYLLGLVIFSISRGCLFPTQKDLFTKRNFQRPSIFNVISLIIVDHTHVGIKKKVSMF